MPTSSTPADWVGRSQTQDDVLAPAAARALAATLDRDDEFAAGTPLPPLWHWLYFLPLARAAELGPDGHPRRGGFLPAVALPRRMWAAGRFEFGAALRIGDAVRRVSTIEAVQEKTGRSGALVFVTVRHEFTREGDTAPVLFEWHDIVYREAPRVGAAPPAAVAAPADASWQRRLVPDEVLLFRYSALTFNGHRIHYDRRYVSEVEGYPGLVVHGPLVATLLLDLLRRELPRATLARFEFRARRPAFDGRTLVLAGRASPQPQPQPQPQPGVAVVQLWAADDAGALVMDAQAVLKTL